MAWRISRLRRSSISELTSASSTSAMGAMDGPLSGVITRSARSLFTSNFKRDSYRRGSTMVTRPANPMQPKNTNNINRQWRAASLVNEMSSCAVPVIFFHFPHSSSRPTGVSPHQRHFEREFSRARLTHQPERKSPTCKRLHHRAGSLGCARDQREEQLTDSSRLARIPISCIRFFLRLKLNKHADGSQRQKRNFGVPVRSQ